MNRNLPRIAALGLCLITSLSACKNENTPATGNSAGTTAAAESGNKVAAQITGAGASFVYPLMSKWSADYAAATGNKVNYQSIGSGGGIAQIKAGTVDFGSSDKPLPPEELAQDSLVQFPSTIGGVVPVINLPGIQAGTLRLTGALLADIYLGKVTTWNDAAIATLNPGVALPADKIHVVRRSDGSGTTFNFTNYLSKVSPAWNDGIGEGTSVNWAGSTVGGKGNEGVASYVQQLKGSIGYVELSYALQNKMAYASMQNAAGNWMQPNAESFAAAAASADWVNAKDFSLVITNAPGAQAWPITATNFILMRKQPRDAAAARAALDFFRWAYASGTEQAKSLDYVPLPAELVTQIEAYWAAQLK
ncbi:phosphate ABC transporter substrate-binding protein PstS [Thermomonas sp.]|uniref:phosphate ABC transporter substrate-binding protein PstS n=1 Tax=Thermomonas sp. TaxID=1971895 RepID=UPI0024894A9A|nr:phosphate ABC transporter substrate-binding protein PstS [Thermomonas sp.]MDI1252849.1 phosphate ABC transporter substrate-binding protein PstS [Thermomonas sp.]